MWFEAALFWTRGKIRNVIRSLRNVGIYQLHRAISETVILNQTWNIISLGMAYYMSNGWRSWTSLRKGHSRLSQREATGSPATTHKAKMKRLDRSPMETSALVQLVTVQAHRVTVTWTDVTWSTYATKTEHRPIINSTEYSPVLEVGDHHTFMGHLLLLAWRYNSGRVLAFSTIPFHLRRSWACSVHFMSFIFFRSFLTSSSHRDLGIPTGLPVNGFHLCIFFTILVSGILFVCPNQLNLWALT